MAPPLQRLLAIFLATSGSTVEIVSGWSRGPAFRGVGARRRAHPSSFTTSTLKSKSSSVENDFYIRTSQYGDLGGAADVIISSFYANATSPWKQLYRMAEMSRLQQGFSYDKELHRMLLAISTVKGEEEIVGFCDVDARIPNQKTSYTYNPRPYLSDLAVHPDHRRKGVAKALIETSEAFCLGDLNRNEIYIRVEKINTAALSMYQALNYFRITNPDDPLGNIVVLRKRFDDDEADDSKAEECVRVDSSENP
jgi:ribosomal protein S18 acetylase RimI-like enzyme